MTDLETALREFADRSPLVVASDFDGVLAPLVDDPMASRALPESMVALRAMSQLAGVTVALVSGRDLSTLRHLTGVAEQEPIVLVGSHGAQASDPDLVAAEFDPAAERRLTLAEDAMAQVAARHPGLRMEGKPTGVVLHSRGMRADAEAAALADAHAAVAPIADVVVLAGKNILEVQAVNVSKGVALQTLSAQNGSAATIYFGDDVTDETAFETLAAEPANVTVKVGAGPTAARFRVDDPAAVAVTLAMLLRYLSP